MTLKQWCLLGALAVPGLAYADLIVEMHEVTDQGTGQSKGTVTVGETPLGLVFTPFLHGLPSGMHGFHVHQNASCEPGMKDGKAVAGLAAGGHYDPKNSGKHDLPWGDGHLGDLPALFVDSSGNGSNPVLAPRLRMADMQGRSIMVHMHGDNYSDSPKPLGGGGPRIVCGVVM